jgi:hypothetical protein
MGSGETMGQVIVIKRENTDSPFEVRQDELHAEGATLGAALDRLLDQIGELDETLVLVRQGRPDRFFTQQDYDRRRALASRAKGEGEPLTAAEEEEMDALIAKEFRATIQRADSLIQQQAA